MICILGSLSSSPVTNNPSSAFFQAAIPIIAALSPVKVLNVGK